MPRIGSYLYILLGLLLGYFILLECRYCDIFSYQDTSI
jgi:hypothetical protein